MNTCLTEIVYGDNEFSGAGICVFMPCSGYSEFCYMLSLLAGKRKKSMNSSL